MDLFEYIDYKAFLKEKIRESGERGYLTQIAEAASCQKSYLTQVLNHHVHFTPEHAAGISIFFNFDESEGDYFIELVNLARAGSEILKKRIQRRLAQIKQERLNLSKRFKVESISDDASRALYYSHWLISAVHMAVTIPGLTTPKSLSQHFHVEETEIQKILEKLNSLGVVEKEGGRWKTTSSLIHLPKDSMFSQMNHLNWRMQAVLDSQKANRDHVHYTSIASLSKIDFQSIQATILRMLDQQRKTITSSKEEILGCFTCDWFEV